MHCLPFHASLSAIRIFADVFIFRIGGKEALESRVPQRETDLGLAGRHPFEHAPPAPVPARGNSHAPD